MTKIAIIGAGGHGREIAELILDCIGDGQPYELLGHIVDPQYGRPGDDVNGRPILGGFDWIERNARDAAIVCAVGAPQWRRQVAFRARALEAAFTGIIHPRAVVGRTVRFGEGVVVAAGCVLTTNIRVGDHVHLNLGCTVGHDAVLGDFATLSQGVRVPGFVRIGEGCNVGTGANLVDRITLGEWSIIGAGSAVIGDVPPDTTVVGVPAKVIMTRPKGWHEHT